MVFLAKLDRKPLCFILPFLRRQPAIRKKRLRILRFSIPSTAFFF